MPLYRFNLRNGHGLIEDEEGRELADAEAVRAEAVKGIRSILCEELLTGRVDLRGQIEVLDESGSPFIVVPFTDAMSITWPGK